MRLVDTHSHIDVDAFDADRAATLERARQVGVVQQIVPAIDVAGWPNLRDVCANSIGLFPAYGLHPIYLAHHLPEHLVELRAWLEHERERCVAVGEIGLDYYVEGLDRDLQQHYFETQLKLAREFDLPVVVHARRAVDAVIATLRRIGNLRGVAHSFAGSAEQANQLDSLGFLIGVGGPVTYERAQRMRRVVAALPAHQFLLETDSPDQPDSDHRGQRNEPARLSRVLEEVASLRGQTIEEIAAITTANATRLFRLPAST